MMLFVIVNIIHGIGEHSHLCCDDSGLTFLELFVLTRRRMAECDPLQLRCFQRLQHAFAVKLHRIQRVFSRGILGFQVHHCLFHVLFGLLFSDIGLVVISRMMICG